LTSDILKEVPTSKLNAS
jgi:hypothetical protein